MAPTLRRVPALAAPAVALALLALVSSCTPAHLPAAPAGEVAPPPSPVPSDVGSPGGPAEPAGPSGPPASALEDSVDAQEGIDSRPPVAIPPRIELYPLSVSIVPGESLRLAVSTAATTYAWSIERVDATAPGGREVVASSGVRVGHDYRSLATFDTATRTARANWPVTDTVPSAGWTPGVYIVTAHDSAGTLGKTIFVVRTPLLQADRPVFVFTALTYEAYNLWGGANLYSYAAPRATRVSFERPNALGEGTGYWDRGDERILGWLQLQHLPLQYTTDYDLALDPPAVAPRLLILPRHAEYVPGTLRDWVEEHVDVAGDMNVLDFGANGFYWQVRLAPPRTAGAPLDIVCWKEAARDPMAAIDPTKVTVRWREAPLDRPEGAVFGAQYTGVVGDGFVRRDFVVTAAMPPELLAGTGWSTGTVVRGLLYGETDAAYPGSGGIAIMDGLARDPRGAALASSVTIRTSPAGARVFVAGTFAWADGFEPPATDLGVPAASFDRFTRNVLAWLGYPVGS